MLNLLLQRVLFSTYDYRVFLRAVFKERGGERGYRRRLADFAGCQPAYLSHVMAGKAEFTPEHAERLCHFLDLSDSEAEYFFQLVHLARAGTASLKARIEKRLKEVAKDWEDQASTYATPNAGSMERAAACYRTWKHSAIHILLTVPNLQSPSRLAKILKIDTNEALELLRELEQVGLVAETKTGWKCTQAQVHSTHRDFFAEVHHRNWRIQALEAKRTGGQGKIRYTMLHTLSRADYGKICDYLEQLILDTRSVVEKSPEEMGACLLVDYFPMEESAS